MTWCQLRPTLRLGLAAGLCIAVAGCGSGPAPPAEEPAPAAAPPGPEATATLRMSAEGSAVVGLDVPLAWYDAELEHVSLALGRADEAGPIYERLDGEPFDPRIPSPGRRSLSMVMPELPAESRPARIRLDVTAASDSSFLTGGV